MNISGSSSYLNQANFASTTSSERIASGKRINSAADDAAGSAIANRLTSEIKGSTQAIRNTNDGISMLQTAGAGLSSLTEGIQRMRELALQASNGTLNDSDRKLINAEAQQIKDELTRTIETSQFNGKSLLNSEDAVSLQVGQNEGDQLDVQLGNFEQTLEDTDFSNIDLSSSEGALSAIDSLDQLQSQVNSSTADIGAGLNRLDSTISNLGSSELNAAESRSRIEDADMAKEISDLTSARIKEEASIALQSQANARRGDVLKLLDSI